MADQTIDQLGSGSPAQPSDEMPIWRSGSTLKLSLSDLSGVVGAGDTLNTVAASGSSQTINYTTADVWDITLTANCSFSLSGFTNAKPDFLTLVLRQDATGSRTVTWPTITWIGSGIAPILQTAGGSVDSVVLFSFDGGTTVFGVAQSSASGLKAGTSFPGSPSDGDLFYRSDRRILYEWQNSVSSWLSVDRKYVPFTGTRVLNSTGTTGVYGWLPLFEDVYIESWASLIHIGTPNDGSNFYTVTFAKNASNQAGTTISSFSTSSDGTGVNAAHNISVASVVAAASFPSLGLNVAKTGTPSVFDLASVVIMRSVG